jgi:hypothetical protein
VIGLNVLPLEGVKIIAPESRRFLFKLVNCLRDGARTLVIVTGVPPTSLPHSEGGPFSPEEAFSLGSHGLSSPELDKGENGGVRFHTDIALVLVLGSLRVVEEEVRKAFSGECVHGESGVSQPPLASPHPFSEGEVTKTDRFVASLGEAPP